MGPWGTPHQSISAIGSRVSCQLSIVKVLRFGRLTRVGKYFPSPAKHARYQSASGHFSCSSIIASVSCGVISATPLGLCGPYRESFCVLALRLEQVNLIPFVVRIIVMTAVATGTGRVLCAQREVFLHLIPGTL